MASTQPPIGLTLSDEMRPVPAARGTDRRAARLRAVRAFLRIRHGAIGTGLLVTAVLFCFLGPVVYRTDQQHANLAAAYLAPSGSHPLGTDQVGYDQLGRLMYGGQTSLEIGLAAAVVAVTVGSLYGAFAGFVGGIADAAMMRIVDGLLAIPGLILVLVLASIFHTTKLALILIIAFFAWLPAARLVRGEALTLRVREYVQIVRAMGGSRRRAIVNHILPNAIGTVAVFGTFAVADAILILSAMGFLGFGLPPPQTDWGSMLSTGVQLINRGYWWLIFPPGIAIIAVVIGIAMVGDALREVLDPRLQRGR